MTRPLVTAVVLVLLVLAAVDYVPVDARLVLVYTMRTLVGLLAAVAVWVVWRVRKDKEGAR